MLEKHPLGNIIIDGLLYRASHRPDISVRKSIFQTFQSNKNVSQSVSQSFSSSLLYTNILLRDTFHLSPSPGMLLHQIRISATRWSGLWLTLYLWTGYLLLITSIIITSQSPLSTQLLCFIQSTWHLWPPTKNSVQVHPDLRVYFPVSELLVDK